MNDIFKDFKYAAKAATLLKVINALRIITTIAAFAFTAMGTIKAVSEAKQLAETAGNRAE